MGVTFLHIESEKYAGELDALSKISSILKDSGLKRNDKFWTELIMTFFKDLYENMSHDEKSILQNKNEREIKEFIRRKLELNKSFSENYLLIVDLETQNSHSKLLGYYDVKVRSSCWNSYFTFECKCLDNTAFSISEYVYNPNKNSKNKGKYEDGGMYRFLINKYSTNLNFGGMIGFLQKGSLKTTKKSICNQIQSLCLIDSDIEFGNLIGICDTIDEYIFFTDHNRYDIIEKKQCGSIKLHHLIYDFTA